MQPLNSDGLFQYVLCKVFNIKIHYYLVGRTKSYEMKEESNRRKIMDPSGFPEMLEYTITMDNHQTLDLQLQLDRSLKMPPSLIQKANGQLEEKPASKTVCLGIWKCAKERITHTTTVVTNFIVVYIFSIATGMFLNTISVDNYM